MEHWLHVCLRAKNNTEAFVLFSINYFKNFPSSSDLLNRKCQCCLIKSQQWITDHVYQLKKYWNILILLSKDFPSCSVLSNRKCQCCVLVLRQWNTDCVHEPNNCIILFTLTLHVHLYLLKEPFMFPQYIVHRHFGHEENTVSVKNYQKIN